MGTPGNPFIEFEEGELETPTQEHERQSNRTDPRNEARPGEPEDATFIGPQNLRNKKKLAQDIDELKETLKLVLAHTAALKAQYKKIGTQNEEIKAQNKEIRAQNVEIKTQCEDLKKQLTNLQATTTAARGNGQSPNTPTYAGAAARGLRTEQGLNKAWTHQETS
jgi:cell division protein FtsB